MTFDRIEETLGFQSVNSIAAAVLDAAREARTAQNAPEQEYALRELMTALLAVIVTRQPSEGERRAVAEDCSERLQALVDTMCEISDTEQLLLPRMH